MSRREKVSQSEKAEIANSTRVPASADDAQPLHCPPPFPFGRELPLTYVTNVDQIFVSLGW